MLNICNELPRLEQKAGRGAPQAGRREPESRSQAEQVKQRAEARSHGAGCRLYWRAELAGRCGPEGSQESPSAQVTGWRKQ